MTLQKLLDRNMALAFGKPNQEARESIEALKLTPAAKAGVWVLHDFQDEAHKIVAELEIPDAAYWHAIIHRREPDPYNAKYWYRQVADHAITEELVGSAAEIGYKYSNGIEFTSYCELVRGSGNSGEKLAIEVQKIEWTLLFNHCKTNKL